MEDDGDERDDTKRKTRNLGEKKRRDQFNVLISELSILISNTNRKMDKSTILKSTISFLKNHNELTVRSRANDVQDDWKPDFLTNEEFTYLVMEALEGFIMVFSTNGYIHYVSDNINSLLGYNPDDIIDKNIFELMHETDQHHLYNLLQRYATEHIENQSKENEMISFQVHLRQGSLDFREEGSYDVVQFYGHFRINQEPANEREVLDFQDRPSISRLIFVCIGCLCTPKLIRDVSLVDSTRNEFSSRHSLEWKFLFLDHRAPPIIGYLPFEVLGTSAYDYYHFEDLDNVVTSHKALIQKGELTSCYYRFLTKGQQWIWLQTRFYITYHQWNAKPEFVVCTHRVVSYAEVTKCKEEVIEQDTEMSESDNTTLKKEMPVKGPTFSPPFNISQANTDGYANAYKPDTKPASVNDALASSTGGEAMTTGDTWNRGHTRYSGGSDTSMSSEESQTSQRNSERDVRAIPPLPQPQQATKRECVLAPQHSMGAQYLDPPRYVPVPVPPCLLSVEDVQPLDRTQIQLPWQHLHRKHEEQLNRKHVELQTMIERQLEELREVKEQLMLARLGMLQPLASVTEDPYSPDDMQNQDPLYSNVGSLPQMSFSPPPHQQHPDHQHMPQ